MTGQPSERLALWLGDIVTPRLRLVALAPGDAAAVHAVTDDPAIIRSISFLTAPFSRADAQALIRRGQGADECFLGIRDAADGRLLGIIGAHLQGEDTVEIGYWVASAFTGRGIASEATAGLIGRLRDRLPDRRIVAECLPENAASWRILTRAGFTPTGIPGRRPGRQLLELAG